MEGRSVPLSTGQVVHIAEGAVKAIANDGDEPPKVLAVLVLDPSRPPFTPMSEGSPA